MIRTRQRVRVSLSRDLGLFGVVTLFTAIVYAELGSCFPEAGGGYLGVKESLGGSEAGAALSLDHLLVRQGSPLEKSTPTQEITPKIPLRR